jgi:hypothetical protein
VETKVETELKEELLYKKEKIISYLLHLTQGFSLGFQKSIPATTLQSYPV